ncbi:MAG: HK97 gp10 family phage protein [Clostridium sp.]|uniref:HK97 gp10 family phage protein n=1 Tax=Clostridium TaxID=1485 RepID=UPI0024818C3B|nr:MULTISPECIES: HK97 gp10 family phage protein [Clostridium]MDB2086861.1 HK97 gp10 family phage protein [Clostridium paraputrificum]MDU1127292.1 HK97 gp10 family phage protein [Clostridium sp.]MDU3678076.1 HK97 gp10 family phage protein [Clostridium sp.]MDU6876146.1 HK97 gp10 family phage protein [Clostridium sp.]MDU6937199.1 HK97 gp10 family phage protein [Clostridium sp.]
MSFDYKEFEKFVDTYKKAAIEFDKFLNKFLIKCALDALGKTKKRTPVDTGGLKRNWFITRVMKKGDELVVWLYNSQDYASFVEYGHTDRSRTNWVEGYFMATISIEEVQRKIPQRFEREFEKFMLSLEV